LALSNHKGNVAFEGGDEDGFVFHCVFECIYSCMIVYFRPN
jgi:hypothetical protein